MRYALSIPVCYVGYAVYAIHWRLFPESMMLANLYQRLMRWQHYIAPQREPSR